MRTCQLAGELRECSAFDASPDACVEFTCGVAVVGDVTISVSHARSTLGSKVQGGGKGYATIAIGRVSFHTSFVDRHAAPSGTIGVLKYHLHELDGTDDECKYGRQFWWAGCFTIP